MSNFTTKPQVPTQEKVVKRNGVAQSRGYISRHANGAFSIYDNIGAAPDAAALPSGVAVLVRNASNLDMYVVDAGAYKLVN